MGNSEITVCDECYHGPHEGHAVDCPNAESDDNEISPVFPEGYTED